MNENDDFDGLWRQWQERRTDEAVRGGSWGGISSARGRTVKGEGIGMVRTWDGDEGKNSLIWRILMDVGRDEEG